MKRWSYGLKSRLRDDIFYRRQARRRPATSRLPQRSIAAADFETVDGSAWLFSMAWYHNGEMRSDVIEYDSDRPFILSDFYLWISSRCGRTWRTGGGGKGFTHPYLFYWNLSFDAAVIIKELADDAIDILLDKLTVVVDGRTHELVDLEKDDRGKWIIPRGEERDLIEVHYLPRKNLRLKALGKFRIQPSISGFDRRMGRIEMFDIMQFHGGGGLDFHSQQAMEDGLIERKKMGDIDRARINETEYRTERYDDLLQYALVDSEVTLELAYHRINLFEDYDVRMTQPYSLASIAERNLLDTCTVPTLNKMMANKHDRDICLGFWSAYGGGWFETTGAGRVNDVRAFDLASAYPYVMYHLPDPTVGHWSRGREKNSHLFWEWMDERQPYTLGVAECIIKFPDNLPLYPALKMSSFDCTVNPQRVRGWFTADELAEFRQWDAEIFVDRWYCHYPDPDGDYPLREFVDRWYSLKYEESMKKGTPEFDKRRYQIYKDCVNSCYGKLIQTVELDDGRRKTGKMWNPIWGATVTGATRARMAEFARVNGVENVVAMATDGIIIRDSPNLVLPSLPLPACYNLGEWEEETPDGLADVVIMMSGVYSMRGVEGKVKTGYRGVPALFIGRDDQPSDWFQFCDWNSDKTHIIRDEENHPNSRPYSLGEARIRGDYSLVNVFRVVRCSMRALGDSNKRRWLGKKPETFHDLLTEWYESSPHRTIP